MSSIDSDFDNAVYFEVECRLCSTSFHYMTILPNVVTPRCPRCGEERRLKCRISGTKKTVKPHEVITTKPADAADGPE